MTRLSPSITLHWCVQVKDVMKDVMAGLQQTNSEKILLSWVRQSTRHYPQVTNTSPCWSIPYLKDAQLLWVGLKLLLPPSAGQCGEFLQQLEWRVSLQCPDSQPQVRPWKGKSLGELSQLKGSLCPLDRPELIDWSSVEEESAVDRLENAFKKAEQHLGIERLLDPEGTAGSITQYHHSLVVQAGKTPTKPLWKL